MNVSRRLCAILTFELDTVNFCSGSIAALFGRFINPLLMHARAATKDDRNFATLCNTVDLWQVAG